MSFSIASIYLNTAATIVELPFINGSFRFSFYAFMYCNDDEQTCAESTDQFHMKISDPQSIRQFMIVKLDEFDVQKRWKKFEFYFTMSNKYCTIVSRFDNIS